MKKYEQFQMCLAEVNEIKGLDSYHTIFLGTMMLRKLRHPEEGLKEIVTKTQKTMKSRYSCCKLDNNEEKLRITGMNAVNRTAEEYGKKDFVLISTDKCIYALEEALEQAQLPVDLEIEGEIAKSVFEYLMEKVKARMEEIAKN